MPWSGAGLFTRLRSWVTDQTNGLSIEADLMDSDTNDLAAGIQACLAKNGENAPTANLPMGGYKHTGVGDGTARAHYASLGQVQDGSALFCSAGGTANALTLAYSPAVVALVDGQEIRFRATATCAAGAATAAVNAISAKSIKRPDGNDPAAEDITSGRDYTLKYNSGSDRLVLLNPSGKLVAADGSALTGVLPTAGGTMAGNINLGGNSSLNDALKAATGTSNTGVTPNTRTCDFTTGDYDTFTATANVKLIPQFPAGGGIGYLDLTNGGAYTITFQSGAKYVGGASPTFTASGLDRVWFQGTNSNYLVVVQKGIA